MEEKAMDEEMMMEAPAPSVVVGASGKIGIKNVDDSSKPNDEQFKLIRAYKVTFDSTGTTDGGLMFGAGMSIRDDTGEEDMPVVKGSYVFVGGADGSWKLQFGGNDPGIDLAGGFGVAHDHFRGEDDTTIALSGSFGDTKYRITAAKPGDSVARVENISTADTFDAYKAAKAADNDWSVGVSHSINTISVGVGMDSEDGLAVGVGTDLSGVSTFLYWSKSEYKNVLRYGGNANGSEDIVGSYESTGLGVKASMSAGEGATFSVGYSTLKVDGVAVSPNDSVDGTGKTKQIEIDFTYDLGGGATLKAGIDKKDKVSSVITVEGNNIIAVKAPSSVTTTLEAAIAFSF